MADHMPIKAQMIIMLSVVKTTYANSVSSGVASITISTNELLTANINSINGARLRKLPATFSVPLIALTVNLGSRKNSKPLEMATVGYGCPFAR